VQHAGTTVQLTPTGNSFISGPFNFAKQVTSGIDFDASYRHKFGSDITLNLRGILTYTFKKNNFTDVTDPKFADRQLSELGDPIWQGQLSANFEKGMFNLGYRFRFVGRTVVNSTGLYETQHSFQGRPPTNPDAFPILWYPNETYHDFRLDISPESKFRFYVGVDNAFDKLPPLDLLGNEAGVPYSPVGRFFYAGAEVKF
jgi:outer membrane receptor protein involved in Fe transport